MSTEKQFQRSIEEQPNIPDTGNMVHESKMPEPVAHFHSNGEFCCDRQIISDVWPVYLYSADDVERIKQEATRQAMERALDAVEFEKVDAEATKHHHDYLYNAALDHAKDGIRRALTHELEKRHD